VTTRWLLIGDPDWSPLAAFAEGLRSVGVDPIWCAVNLWQHDNCDVVVTYGLRNHGRDVLDYYEPRGVPVIVLDHGYMRRVQVAADLKTAYLQVGVNRLGWVPERVPSGDRFAALGITPRRREPKEIRRAVIMGQVPYDASHRLNVAQLTQCYESLYDELRQAGVRNIAFRGHPQATGVVNPNIPKDDMRPLDDAIQNADLVVSINSNSGLDALIDGCPAAVLKSSHYTECAYRWPTLLSLIEPPEPDALNNLLERLAYAQWTDAEIREGLPHRFLASIGAVP
jgi:hypothetical protein